MPPEISTFAETRQGLRPCIRFQSRPAYMGAVVAWAAAGQRYHRVLSCNRHSQPKRYRRTAEWIFASAQTSGVGNNCAAGGCLMNFNVQPWKASTAYAIGQEVLDTHFQIQVVRVAGTSRTAALGIPPGAWRSTGARTDAGTLRWTNQGPYVVTHPAWLPSHAYAAGAEILDSNGKVEWVAARQGHRRPARPGLEHRHQRHDRGRYGKLAKLGSHCHLQPGSGWRHQRHYYG